MTLNNDFNTRDLTLFGEPFKREKYMGGIRHFDYIDPAIMLKLLHGGFIDPNDVQNNAPTAKEIIDFLCERTTAGWYAHGYAVSPLRDDYRISIEGCGKNEPPTVDEIIAFAEMFREADEFQLDKEALYCWFD